jgi:hypothetical protein
VCRYRISRAAVRFVERVRGSDWDKVGDGCDDACGEARCSALVGEAASV